MSVFIEPSCALYLIVRNASTTHVLAHTVLQPAKYRDSSKNFFRVSIDACFAHTSTCGEKRYESYCAHTGRCWTDSSHSNTAHFRIGKAIAHETAHCVFFIGSIWLTIIVHTWHVDISLLLSSANINLLPSEYDYQIDILNHKPSGENATIQKRYGHPFYYCQNRLDSFFKEIEL